ncbi:MAG: dienelactone hydrolase family protein [Gammaproteobacteria bacterium]|nr:dienelactone hydrolase family protein [Gammaproteobacteria bacterium]
MSRVGVFLSLLTMLAGTVQAEVQGMPVEYRSGDRLLKGYLAYDDAISGKRPGVLVVHEWWGHNEYARERARMLAAQGYTALAVDMYGDGKQANHPKDAGQFAGEVRNNMDAGTARFNAGVALLKQHETVAADGISAIGYCFGGGVVLEMARRGVDLDVVGSFHGSLGTENPAAPGSIRGRVLVFNGADDPFVKPEQIATFKAEMQAASPSFMFVDFPGVKHSFTNPGADEKGAQFNLPLAYDAAADQTSWEMLLEALKQAYPG